MARPAQLPPPSDSTAAFFTTPPLVRTLQAGVLRPGGRRGRVPGLTILRSPYRNEINAMLFVERLPFKAIVDTAHDRWGLRLSTEILTRYVAYLNECVDHEVTPIGGHTQVVVEELHTIVEGNVNFLKSYVAAAQKKLTDGKLTIEARDAIQAIQAINRMMGDRATIDQMVDTAKWRDALAAILRIVQEVCSPEQQERIAGLCAEDPTIRAVMSQQGASDATEDDTVIEGTGV